jgi:MraZ protein
MDGDQSRDGKGVELPRGRYPARLDEKGRLKLPAVFKDFFDSLPEKKLFVTSLDRRIAQIYPIDVWRQNEIFFKAYRAEPKRSHNVLFTAQDLGSEVEADSQGRVLFNTDLRRELDMEGQELHLIGEKGHVQVLTEALYQERKQQSAKSASEDLEFLEQAGLL